MDRTRFQVPSSEFRLLRPRVRRGRKRGTQQGHAEDPSGSPGPDAARSKVTRPGHRAHLSTPAAARSERDESRTTFDVRIHGADAQQSTKGCPRKRQETRFRPDGTAIQMPSPSMRRRLARSTKSESGSMNSD